MPLCRLMLQIRLCRPFIWPKVAAKGFLWSLMPFGTSAPPLVVHVRRRQVIIERIFERRVGSGERAGSISSTARVIPVHRSCALDAWQYPFLTSAVAGSISKRLISGQQR